MPNYYCTLRGTLSSANLQEIFVQTFAVISTQSDSGVANTISSTWLANVDTANWTGSTQYAEATAATILAQEGPDFAVAKAFHSPCVLVGSSLGGMLPSQNAVRVSSRVVGGKPNGTDLKGGFYLPGPAASHLDPVSGLLITSFRDDLVEQMRSWATAMNSAGCALATWSRRHGIVLQWDSIRIGDRVDTIRRRRNELPEIYSPEPVLLP